MSLAETLRKACAANGLGVSGSADQLLARLCRGSKAGQKKAPRNQTKTSKPKTTKTCKGGACQPGAKNKQGAIKKAKAAAKRTPFKATKTGGLRLSAASYFYDVCDGKISRCTPQPIVQPDGRVKIKTIRIVEGAHGKHPRWVLAD